MKKLKKPKDGWPMFFGIDHWEGGGNGMKEKLEKTAKPGTRCFIEAHPAMAKLYNEGGVTLAAGNIAQTITYLDLMEWLHKRGVELIALNRKSVMRLYRNASDNNSRNYVMLHMQERGWRNTISTNVRASDFVVIHPGHLARVIRTWKLPRKRCVFVDKLSKQERTSTTASFDRRLKAKRKQIKSRKRRANIKRV